MGTIAEELGTSVIDHALIERLATRSSREGYISVYGCRDLDDPSRWMVAVRPALDHIARSVEGSHEHRRQVRDAVQRARETISVLPGAAPGVRSVVGFLDVASDGPGTWIGLRVPVRPLACLDELPRIVPLLGLLDRSAFRGVVEFAQDQAVIAEWGNGGLAPLLVHRVEPSRSVRHEHLETGLLGWAAPQLETLARTNHWTEIVVFGHAQAVPMLRERLGPGLRLLEGGRGNLVHTPAHVVRERIGGLLEQDLRSQELQLVGEVLDGTRTLAQVGEEETRRALEEGRVAVLLVADPAGGDEARARRNERMVRTALATNAAVRVLGEDAGALLHDRGGVAVLLRY